MSDKKKTEELNEAELDQITGGASIGDIKPGLTEKAGIRATKGVGIRAAKDISKGAGNGFLSSGSASPTV